MGEYGYSRQALLMRSERGQLSCATEKNVEDRKDRTSWVTQGEPESTMAIKNKAVVNAKEPNQGQGPLEEKEE